jgi:hypothetical protein
LDAVELATMEWVDWYNNRRLFEAIGDIPRPRPKPTTTAHQRHLKTCRWQKPASTKPGRFRENPPLILPLEPRILEVRRGLATLRDQCPGDHRYVRHRDGVLPWCEACGLTNIGLHNSDYGADHEPAAR